MGMTFYAAQLGMLFGPCPPACSEATEVIDKLAEACLMMAKGGAADVPGTAGRERRRPSKLGQEVDRPAD